MAADHRIGEVHVLDLGLQLAVMELADLAAEDGRDLVWLADGAIGVEEPFAESVEGGAAMEDEIVAELGLGEEQPVMAAGVFSLVGGEERGEAGEPLLAAGDEVAMTQFVGQFLQTFGFGAPHECVRALLKVDAFLAHAVCQPMMLVEADPRRERQVGTHAHEHAAPSLVVEIEIVLNDPTLGELQMPAVGRPVADGDHDARRLARLQDGDEAFEIPRPTPESRDLLVEVRAVTVNPVDYKVASARCPRPAESRWSATTRQVWW